MIWSRRDTVMLVAAPALGALLGAGCAYVITLAAFFPRDGSPLDSYFWSSISGYALYLGAPWGAVIATIAYFNYLRRVDLLRALGWTTLGTLLGGFAGALLHPVLAMIAGIGGFILGCKRAKQK